MRRFVPDCEMLRSPLARRLIVAIIVVSSTITLCLTAFQLYGEYRSELESIQDEFRQIEEVHLNSLVQSLWATNEAELQLQIEGMAHVPNIEHIVVREGDSIWAQAGHRTSRRTIERQYPLTYAHRGQTLEIGVLTVVASLDAVYRRLINKAFIILVSNALKTFLVAGFAFAFFHWLVNRHLIAIAKYSHGLDPRRRGWPLILARATGRRPDELDDVATAINLMQENALARLSERSRAAETQARLAAIVEHSSDAVIGRALDGTVTSWNPAAERILGYTAAEVIGRDPVEIMPPGRWQEVVERRHLIQSGEAVPNIETVRIAKDGRRVDVAASISAIKDISGSIIGTAGILRDITSRIEAEKASRKNYELLDRIFATTHFCVVYLDPDFNFVRVNKAYADACGHPAEFFAGKNHFELYPGEEAEAIFRRVVATGEPFTIYANPFEFPDHPEWGVTYWDWTLHPLKSERGDVEGLLFALLDVTERKRSEDAVRSYATRLRELSRRLREVEESERRAISRELHDRIGQGLTTLGLMVGALDARLFGDSRNAVGTQLRDMQALIQYVVAHVRDIMAELRPPVLDDYGLLAALRQLVSECSRRTGIAVNVSGVEPYPRLPPVVETAMFRIIQEALNNIFKHAHAKNVEISLNPASERVVLEIADDGVGFDTISIADGGEHWGMITMRERAEAVGITFRLESAPGAGTRIVFEAERASS